MKKFLTPLLIALNCILLASSTSAQENTFKAGDKVEANFIGVWLKGVIKGKEGEKYSVILDESQGEATFKPKNIRLVKEDPTAVKNANGAVSGTANIDGNTAKETIGNE